MTKQNRKKYIYLALVMSLLGMFAVITLSVDSIVPVSYKTQAQYAEDTLVTRIHSLINTERKKKSLPLLTLSPILTTAAQNKAEEMKVQEYFAHTNPKNGKKWSEFIQETGYNYTIAGENLAKGYKNIDDMIAGWMSSPAHRANILTSAYEETGIGFTSEIKDGIYYYTVVQFFGKT